MGFNVLKYCMVRIPAVLSRIKFMAGDAKIDDGAGPFIKSDKQIFTGIDRGKVSKPDSFDTSHSLHRFLLLLALVILMCGLLLKYLFICFPGIHQTDMPLIGSIVFIVLLSPAFYAFFYRPMIGQISKLKTAEVKMREFAHYDDLTGVYNRRGFLTFAEQFLKLSDREQRGFILIYVDMDNLKKVNDDRGHHEGDRALKSIAEVLKKTFRSTDVVGRVGGDEFAVFAVEAKSESLDALRKRLHKNLEMTADNIESGSTLTFSLGILCYNPEERRSIEGLLKSADELMYEEKRLRKNPALHIAPQEYRI